ncbi:MAG: ribbon-helix-helix domain-containing protein [Candidatus Kariarchaeaceae archaeon]
MHESDRYKNDKLITFKVAQGMDNEMVKLVTEGDYDNRSEFIRKAVEGLLKREA